jgi:hypothetical protein
MGTNVPAIQFTSVGFVAPSSAATLNGVEMDLNFAFSTTFDFNLNTPQGQLASSWAAIVVNSNSTFQYYAQQVDPSYSSGKFQDAIGRIYFMQRNPAQPTALQIVCSGATGTVIALGSLVVDQFGNQFSCVQAGTIPAGGSITLSFQAVVPGATTVPAAVAIFQTQPGWDSATIASGAVGSPVEGRFAFETRRKDSVASNGFGPVGSIIGAVAAVPGVLDYFGQGNPSASPLTINGITIPANGIYICVSGGAPSAVAQAILSKKTPGGPMTGNTTVTVYDSNPLFLTPIPYQITYQIPTSLQILFKVTISLSPLVPSNYVNQVQNALIAAFAGGTLVSSFTGSISGTTLTVSAVSLGTLQVGQTISDLTGQVLVGTTILALGTGVGGIGTYQVSLNQTVASEAMSSETPSNVAVPRARINSLLFASQYVPAVAQLGSWAQVSGIFIGSANNPDASVIGHISGTVLTVTSVNSGTILAGDYVSDAFGRIITGTVITSFGTGVGGTGTYNINNTQTVSGATFTGTGAGTTMTASSVTGTIGIGDTITGTGVPGGTTIVAQLTGTAGGAGTYQTSGTTTSSSNAITCNETVFCSSALRANVQVNANQTPQLVAANIIVIAQ